ncbi:MAG TPA: ribosome-associated translation inhibitor RaiA [Vicinamibacteria bacterium]|jgi:putative sigma-54 modulation protein
MQIEFTGRQTEVTPELKTLAERKLRKVAKVLGRDITSVHVILTADKHRQIAEVSIRSRNLELTAVEESADLSLSLATVMDKLRQQAQRHLGKLRQRKRRAPARATALWSGVMAVPRDGDGIGPRVIRSRRFVVRPMSVEQAVLEVDRHEDGLVVFRDSATERVNVLYRRRDGRLGLIEPEA